MREEGYTETGGGDGLDLQVAPYYANSLRGSIGSDFKTSFNIFGATVSPEARLGYRYDVVDSPVKLKAGFVSTGGLGTPSNTFTFVGPDPDTGNAVAGLSLGAGTDTWQLGVNYDWIRGNNGSTTQVGMLTAAGPHLSSSRSAIEAFATSSSGVAKAVARRDSPLCRPRRETSHGIARRRARIRAAFATGMRANTMLVSTG